MEQAYSTTDQPKISCLMVTKERLEQVKVSIQCYCGQTYVHKELVIIVDGSQEYYRSICQYIDTLSRCDIKVVPATAKLTLGALRNLSMAHATGDVLCQWDDDDLHHSLRLEVQLRSLLGAKGASVCLLSEQLHYFRDTKELYWTDYAFMGGMPGTIMFKNHLGVSYATEGKFASKGEDEDFQKKLKARHKSIRVAGHGFLYVYIFHGDNTHRREHHANLVRHIALPWERIAPSLHILRCQLPILMKKEFPLILVSKDGKRIDFPSGGAESEEMSSMSNI